MALVLKDIISPIQNAFLVGRNMADNINLIQELLWHYGRKRVSPRCLVKIDFRKAFDSVQWPILRRLLQLLGFPLRFVHLVICVSKPHHSLWLSMVTFMGSLQENVGLDKATLCLLISS
jgi:hypothetical protein